MAIKKQNLSDYDPTQVPNASRFKFGLVVSEWNQDITFKLHEGAHATLLKHGCSEENIDSVLVPGSYELTTGAQLMIRKGSYDAIICLGCVIKGETSHNEYINHAVAQGLTDLSIANNLPVIFGLLTPNDMQQALERAGGKHGNKGVEAAITAIKMVDLARELS